MSSIQSAERLQLINISNSPPTKENTARAQADGNHKPALTPWRQPSTPNATTITQQPRLAPPTSTNDTPHNLAARRILGPPR